MKQGCRMPLRRSWLLIRSGERPSQEIRQALIPDDAPANAFFIQDTASSKILGARMIRRCGNDDFDQIWTIINDGAEAYRGIIPNDRWHEPYMTRQELSEEIESGVQFWTYEQDGSLQAVMGVQDVHDVTLIRHAYVRQTRRRGGLGGMLLKHLKAFT